MHDLAIATWRIKTLPCLLDDMAIHAKINAYAEKADGVLLQLEAEARRLQLPNLHRIFLAPEHLFRRSSTLMALHQDEKDQIMRAVGAISARHGDALIIPGTIVWREETKFATLFNRRFEARNTAFVFQNGSVLHNYNKHTDANELAQIELAQCTYRAGQKLGVFRCWNLRFGVEICFDHKNSTLYNNLQTARESPVDVHLVISSSVPNKGGAVAARDGGLFVKSDGGDNKSSHTLQLPGVGARHGVWGVEMREEGRSGAQPAHLRAQHMIDNRGEYVDLTRRHSVTMRGGVVPAEAPAYVFEGFDDDVSVYHVRIPD